MTKEQKIQEAFGKSWSLLSPSMQQHILKVHHWVDRSRNRMNLSPKDLGFDEETECEIHCEFWRPKSLSGIENNNGWIKIESESDLPDEGIEVLCFNKNWINEDFNLKGIRIGFVNCFGWTTAHYWDYQDTYVTISHLDCDNNEGFSDEIRKNIDPTHYRLISDKSPIY
ncbi:hypothetical protein ACVVIH_06980 [Chryseobacterium arthrosphaerae]